MKINQSFRYALLLTAYVSLFACKKNDSKPKPISEPITFSESIVGKWKIGSGASLGRNMNAHHISPKVQEKAQLISVEFFKDSSYIVLLNDNTAFTGKYGIIDSTTINIYGIGDFKDIKIEGEKMNFKLSTESGFIIITANKAAEIPSSSETNKICKNWKLLPGTGGRASYNFSTGEGTRADIRFSSSGTYMLTVYYNDSLAYIRTAEWKWHPALSDTYQYSWGNGTLTDNRPVTIKALADNSLKLEETYYDYQFYNYAVDGTLEGYGDSTLTTRIYDLVPSEY
ncbi:MAG: hypothetical protein J0I84_03065 [Terrimonas sp.]|nr:hypothetical protein [Terrimonas sp.]OJY93843.1 MAG: hypothetical protein BGP13_00940 [Sphingobacteriales bacterium 40-81]